MQLAAKALSQCRQSCKSYFIKRLEKSQPRAIGLIKFLNYSGGIGDVIKDVFGHDIPICDLRHGFNSIARYAVISSRISAATFVNMASEMGFPTYTKVGFEKRKAPVNLFKLVKAIYSKNKWVPEACEFMTGIISGCFKFIDDGFECHAEKQSPTFMLGLGAELEAKIAQTLKPLAETWSGIDELKLGKVYGIRRYTNGRYLTSHVDRADTHIISAIINVGQKLNTPWPLYIMDHEQNHHKVYLQPGEMVWYESSRLPHGRLDRLDGEHFDNLFVHFYPATIAT